MCALGGFDMRARLGLLVLAAATLSLAQTTAGLTGTITDASGAVVPGARVTVTNVDTGVKRDAASNESGLYQFPLLQPGNYSIAVQREGFKAVTRDGVRLEVNQVARIDFLMQL